MEVKVTKDPIGVKVTQTVIKTVEQDAKILAQYIGHDHMESGAIYIHGGNPSNASYHPVRPGHRLLLIEVKNPE